MFTSSGNSILHMFFSAIWQVLNFTIPGTALSIWNLGISIFLIGFSLRMILRLMNSSVSNFVSYGGSSAHNPKISDERKNDNR